MTLKKINKSLSILSFRRTVCKHMSKLDTNSNPKFLGSDLTQLSNTQCENLPVGFHRFPGCT